MVLVLLANDWICTFLHRKNTGKTYMCPPKRSNYFLPL